MASKLAKIEILPNQKPFDLLKEWFEEYKKFAKSMPLLFCLATTSCKGDVTNRFVALRRLEEDGLVFSTNKCGPKARQIEENPKVAACFLLLYHKDNSELISRQVRIEGTVNTCWQNVTQEKFNAFPLHVKLRSALTSEQSKEADWNELKKRHDELLDKVQKNEIVLKPPENLIEYKIIPKSFDFYHACETNNEIADRILFKLSSTGIWTYCHLTP